MTDKTLSKEDAAIQFLVQDFNQCFEQMRHYDSQIADTFKFLFTLYVGLIGASLSLYQIGVQKEIHLEMPGIALLIAGVILGLFLLAIVVRNRAYFVQVTRYINEQRSLYFNLRPMGFENKSRMYTDPTLPPFFDWKSSQLWYVYIISFFNSVLIGVMTYILGLSEGMMIFTSAALFVIQLISASVYLINRENKSAEQAIFGKSHQM